MGKEEISTIGLLLATSYAKLINMKKLASLLIIMQLGISSFSQCYFQNNYGVNQKMDYYRCVNKNSDNNFIVVGTWAKFIDCGGGWTDRPDEFYILEIDSCGLLINEIIIENGEDNRISYIEETDTNSYFLLGSLGIPCESRYFGYMNISSTGEVINSGIFDENYSGFCADATKLSNNNYVMAGNNLVLMVDAQGNTIASKRINSPDEYSHVSLKKISTIPETNSVILIAQLYSPFDFMIIRLDDELNTVWEYIYDITKFDFIQGLTITQDNNIIIAGSTVDTIINSYAYDKVFIQRMNVNGDSLGCNYYAGMDSITLFSVKEVPETKDVIAAGYYQEQSRGSYDTTEGYFMRVDSIGNFINDTRFRGVDREFRNQCVIDSSNIFLFGNTYNYNPNNGDLHIVKTNSSGYQSPSTIIPVISESNDVFAHPNPFRNKVIFNSTRESLIQSIYIFNVYGSIIYIKNGINTSNHTVLTNNFISGVYFCNLILSNGQIISKKIIKQ